MLPTFLLEGWPEVGDNLMFKGKPMIIRELYAPGSTFKAG